MPYRDLDKRRANARERYDANQSQERERSRLRREENRAEWFKDKSCVRCGSVDDLELDHIDPLTKITNVIWSWSRERREQELAKCQVLCKRHHKQKTLEQLSITNPEDGIPFRHGSPRMYNKHGCRCGLCKLQHRNRRRESRKQATLAQSEERLVHTQEVRGS